MIKKYLEDHKLLILLILFSALLYLSISLFSNNIMWDEASYLSTAKYLIGEGQYAEFHRPLLLSLIFGGLWSITGENIILTRMVMIAFSLAAIYMFYKICEIYFKKPIIPAAILAFSPLFVFWSFRAYTDIASLTFILLSFYCYKKSKGVLSGISLSVAFLFRYISGIFCLVFLLDCIMRKKVKRFEKFLLGFAVGLLPWLAANQIYYGNPLYHLFEYISKVSVWTSSSSQSPSTLLFSLIRATSLLLPFAIYGLYKFYREGNHTILFYIPIYFFVYLFLVNLKLSRYIIAILPFILILAWEGLSKVKIPDHIKVLIILITIALASIPVADDYVAYQKSWGPTADSLEYINYNTSSESILVSNFWPIVGFYTNKRSHSPWTDLKNLKENYSADYLLIRNSKPEIYFNNTEMLSLGEKFSNNGSEVSIYEITG